jgi:hypothetical protein
MDANSKLKEAYRSLNDIVVACVSPSDIVDSMFAAGILPTAKYSELCYVPDGPPRTRLLMAFLYMAGHPAAFTKLHETIKKQKPYDWLTEEIDKVCARLTDAAKPEQQDKFTGNYSK